MKAVLHSYQEQAIKHVKENPYCALLLAPGLGKTIITLTAISDMLLAGDDLGKILVVAPLSVAKYTWSAEIAKWDHLSHLTVSLILGNQEEREAAMKREADIYIINRENVPWLVQAGYRRKPAWSYKTVIIDEFSSFKSIGKRWRALRQVRPLITRLIGLTGTPAPNNLLDIWPQMYLIDRGERLETSFGKYRSIYFTPGRSNGYVVCDYNLREGAAETIYDKISDICVSMKAEDYLKLPDRIDNIIPLPLSDAQNRAYKRFKQEKVLSLTDGENASDAIVGATAAVLANKLLQYTGGAVYDEDGKPHLIHPRKTEHAAEIALDMQGEPLLVFYQYKHELGRLLRDIPKAEVFDKDDATLIDRWNRREIPVLLAHPQQAGHGLNLQAGGSTILWFTLPWSLELYQQANARLHRQGQTKSVIVHHLIVPGTIDERVYQVLQDKSATQNALLNALKAEMGFNTKK